MREDVQNIQEGLSIVDINELSDQEKSVLLARCMAAGVVMR
jgi:hypothetical protein